MAPFLKGISDRVSPALCVYALALGLFSLAVYSGITWLDAGELLAASHELGIAHPPGFPLFALGHKLISLVVPLGEIAFRGNLASAILGSACLGFLASSCQLNGSTKLATVVGLVWMCSSPIFALHCMTVEVYSGLALGLGVLSWLWLKGCLTGDFRWSVMSCFVLGLCIGGHHPEFRLFGLVFASFIVWEHRLNTIRLMHCIFFGTIGLAIITYIPIRSRLSPWRNWGDPSNFDRLWDHFWGRRIREAYADEMGHFDWESLAQFIEQLAMPSIFFLAFGLVGLWVQRRSPVGRLMLIICVVDVLYSIIINPMGLRDLQNGTASVCALGCGCVFFVDSILGRAGSGYVPKVSMALTIVCVVLIFPHLRLQTDRAQHRLITHIDRNAPVEALTLVASDDFASGLAYAQVVEGMRPDLAVIVRQHIGYSSSVQPTIRRLPHALPLWQPRSSLEDLSHLKSDWPVLWEWGLGIDAHVRPRNLTPYFPMFCSGVGCTPKEFERPLSLLEADYMPRSTLIGETLDHLGHAGRTALANLRTSYAQYALGMRDTQSAMTSFKKAVELEPWVAKRWTNLGAGFSVLGQYQSAIKATRQGMTLNPHDLIGQINLARYLIAIGYNEEARQGLLALTRKTRSADAYALLGVIAGNESGLERALKYFKMALAIDPEQREARAGLKTLNQTKSRQ